MTPCLYGVHKSLAPDLVSWGVQLQRVPGTGPFKCACFVLER